MLPECILFSRPTLLAWSRAFVPDPTLWDDPDGEKEVESVLVPVNGSMIPALEPADATKEQEDLSNVRVLSESSEFGVIGSL